MTGYKATNADMICSGVGANGKRFSQQYELGKWYECEGELELCKNGFHFCVHPSGVWSYYPGENTRVFVVEAEDVLDTPYEPGAALKKVARRIRLVREITVTGYSNTGDSNTGYRNTGYGNAANNSPDFFSVENPKVKSFDIQTDLTAEEYQTKYPQYWQLCDLLHRPAEIDFSKFSQLPGITKEKLTALHRKHLAGKTKQP